MIRFFIVVVAGFGSRQKPTEVINRLNILNLNCGFRSESTTIATSICVDPCFIVAGKSSILMTIFRSGLSSCGSSRLLQLVCFAMRSMAASLRSGRAGGRRHPAGVSSGVALGFGVAFTWKNRSACSRV